MKTMYILAGADWSICGGIDELGDVYHDKQKAQAEAARRNATSSDSDPFFKVFPVNVGDPK